MRRASYTYPQGRRGSLVVRLRRNDVADTSARIRDVSRPTRNNMDMEMRDGLTASGSIVESYVETVRRVALAEELSSLVNRGN